MKLRRIFNSIVTRLLLLGIAIILVGALVRYLLLGNLLRDDIENLVASQQEALATYVAHDIDYKIRERQAMLNQLAVSLPKVLLKHPESLRAWLGERHELQPLFSQGLFVTDLAGLAISDYPEKSERIGIDYGDRDYIREALAGRASIGRPVIGRVAREPILPMAVPIRDAAGNVQAVLAGITALNAPGFLDLLLQSRIGKSGGFLLVSPRDKLFVAASDPEMVLKPTPETGINLLHDRAMNGFRGTGVTINARGIEESSAMVSVASTGWFVVARMPTAEAFLPVEHARNIILRSLGIVIAIFILLSTGGLIAIFRPLSLAAAHAEKMTRGELPLEPLPVARDDEVGHLTEAFNRLLAKLQVTQVELARRAQHDTLTGLPNRALLADRMQQVLARAHRHDTRLAVLFLDLDGLKPVNDSLGHEAGDAVLVEAARRLLDIVRETDTLARVGGDEFVIVMGDLEAAPGAAEAAARAVAGKCVNAIKVPFALGGREASLGLSIGIALGDCRSDTDELIARADGAMYKAKQAGRGRYQMANGAVGTSGRSGRASDEN